MAIHLSKTSSPSTRNGAVNSQVKSNSRNRLISGQHHCGKGVVMPEESLPQGIEGEVISVYTVKLILDAMKKTYMVES
ncbi:unnamed protein product [Lathyrus oleraceus]